MTATLKGDSLPNRKVFTRDSRDPAIEALQKFPHEMDCQLQGLQQSSNDILEPRSINHVISIAFKEKPKINLQEQVKPLGEKTNPIQLASGIPYIQNYSELPRMF